MTDERPPGRTLGLLAPWWAVVSAVAFKTTAASNVVISGAPFLPTRIARNGRWTYELTANRIDRGAQDEPKYPLFLPPEDLREPRPRLVERLNQADSSARRGYRLALLLDTGLERSSVSAAPALAAGAFLTAFAAAVVAIVAGIRGGSS